MSPKNLSALNKTHKLLLNKLKDKRTRQIYNKFEKYLNINENFAVAVSGGPDSLALSFLAKIYSIKNLLNVKYFIIDHKLRNNSTLEAKNVQKQLKKFSINLNILKWNGIKPKKNIQSIARDKRYELLLNETKKFKIKNILLGHHLDDLFENFFIRILRGSGLNGLISLDKKTQNNNINIIRPLLNFEKKDLTYISKFIFGFFVEDPSNEDDKFKRVKIRGFLKKLETEGLDKKKFKIKNILLGHHLDDLFENFFIRILRGSGLNGLISLDKKTQNNNINIIRPLLNFEKKDLIYVSKYIFGFFVEDPSNEDDKFKRVKIRGFLKKLETEGLDKKKFLLTINNLKFSNETIKFYTKKNLLENTYFSEKKKLIILKESFFHHSAEVIFRSFTDVIKIVGKKYYPVRGKKIDSIIQLINNKSYFKVTLGGCVIKKVNQTVIVSKE